jgi:Protein of unknown function (DUF3455)
MQTQTAKFSQPISTRKPPQQIEDFLMKRTNTLPTSLMAALLGLGLTAAGQAAHAEQVTPPNVPNQLEVQGNTAFLVGHATGTQNYVCLPATPPATGFAYVLFTPEATLFDDHGKQIITHYFSPNLAPDPGEIEGTIRATWQTSDTSIVWAKATANATHATDPDFVEEGAVAWLTLARVGAQDGPRGEDTFADVTFVQRLNTHGGLAPTDCTSLAAVGKVAFMPYTADYFFYSADDAN